MTSKLNGEPFRKDATYRRYRWAVLVLGLLIYIPNAGSFGLWDPWETHYGEVTRTMVETHDYVSPWWGFHEKIGTEKVQGKPFFSKPVYLFWIEGISIRVLGYSEWAIRLPIAAIAILAMFSLFWALARIFRPQAAFWAAVVAGTSPQFFFLGRQAQTDMPFVGTMTIALAFFMAATFGRREFVPPKKLLWRFLATVALVSVCVLPQFGIIATDLAPDPAFFETPFAERWGQTLWQVGTWHALIGSLLFAVTLLWMVVPFVRGYRRGQAEDAEWSDRWLRRCYLWAFYVFCAHATLAKGLLGFMLPGAIIFLYLVVTRSWRLLRRVEILRGTLVFILVSFPWYTAMFARHGLAYWKRFFIHDHFNRLGAGVHQIDSGTFEHFLKWLGYGMFPWVALVPFAVLALYPRWSGTESVSGEVEEFESARKARIFAFLWFFVSYTLFTVSSTKFHHYIFPALPGMAIIVGLFVPQLLASAPAYRRLVGAMGAIIAVSVLVNLKGNLQALRNLFTYKYDRTEPTHLPVDVDAPIAAGSDQVWGESLFWEDTNALILNLLDSDVFQFGAVLASVGAVVALGYLLLLSRSTARWSPWVVFGGAGWLAVYCLNVYMPMLTPHWSQKHLFDRYYEVCTVQANDAETDDAYEPGLANVGLGGVANWLGARSKTVCEEDIISWLITWRGETFYSNNEIWPINKEAAQFESYLRDFNRGRPFFVMMERGKEKSLQRKLNKTYLKKKLKDDEAFASIDSYEVEKIFDENRYFILVRVTPKLKPVPSG